MTFNPQPKKKRIKLSPREWQKLRKEKWFEADGRCWDCGEFTKLHGTLFSAGHLCHIKSKGAGGDDSAENTRIKCYACHIGMEHGPRWGVDEEE